MIHKSEVHPSPFIGFTMVMIDSMLLTNTFMDLIHRLKNLQGKASLATHSMQLAENNNAMWRVIINGDQPLPHSLQRPDLNGTKKVI